jgi:hypothetical protein
VRHVVGVNAAGMAFPLVIDNCADLLFRRLEIFCAVMAMSLKTPAFKQNGHIPSKYTCEAEDASPPLAHRLAALSNRRRRLHPQFLPEHGSNPHKRWPHTQPKPTN